MKIEVPELSLVVLIGTSGTRKSTFASRHFKPTEVLSSDHFRGLLADDPDDHGATGDAFETLHYVTAKRLAAGRFTVVDATDLQLESKKLVVLARQYHCRPVAIVFAHAVENQHREPQRSLEALKHDGFRHVFVLEGPEAADAAELVRVPLRNNLKSDAGPFDIIGDVHGCLDELCELLNRLGYRVSGLPDAPTARPPSGRRAVFLGDLVDRGPEIVGVLKLVMAMVRAGHALCLPGNHEIKLMRKLRGRDVRITHGLAQTLEQFTGQPSSFAHEVCEFFDSLVSHYVFDEGNLVVAHAGLTAELQGRASAKVRRFCLYGETTGEIDDFGLRVQSDWTLDYRGKAHVVYGHAPVPVAEWQNRTICIDTGCVFGGSLTALRWPERELVQVKAKRTYYEPAKPFSGEQDSAPSGAPLKGDELLDIKDVLGKRIVTTRFHVKVTVREENARAALELMSRFAVAPNWLVYLPPTMAPSETAAEGPLLEHPREAFAYYQRHGVAEVICEEKHKGCRVVLVVCRDRDAAVRRFGSESDRLGVIVTRTGRPCFPRGELERALVERVRRALSAARFWERLSTDWVCLDAELLPWSARAREPLCQQYAATGAAAAQSLRASVAALELAKAGIERTRLLASLKSREQCIALFVAAYRRYCWPVDELAGLRLAPFHVLASERKVHSDQTHLWHMQTLAELCRQDPELFSSTPYRIVKVLDRSSQDAAIAWWTELTQTGSEGMVVKPTQWVVQGEHGLVQPAIKCRGPESLRMIYGPEYDEEANLERLRKRRLSMKRALATREFALGLEALHRFVEREPLYRVHECVFGVLALESEPVDPRL